MFGPISNIMTLVMVAALAVLMALAPVHPRAELAFWGLAALFIAHLVWHVRRQRRLAGQAARRLAASGHFPVPTNCLLDWPEWSANFDPLTRQLLQDLVNRGPQDGRALRPLLEQVLPRLKRLTRRYPHDPGPPAYRAWSLILLGRVDARESPDEPGLETPEHKFWKDGLHMYARAAELAPDEARLAADWALALEDRAALLKNDGADNDSEFHLGLALEKYERAVELDPGLFAAWRGLGRVLERLAPESDRSLARNMLNRAAAAYERAQGAPEAGPGFYDEFGRVVYTLAQYESGPQAARYYGRAAELFQAEAEAGREAAGPRFRAGQALHQAAAQTSQPDQAAELYRRALAQLQRAVELEKDEPRHHLWAARCLLALFQLPGDREEKDGTELLTGAFNFCAQAALLSSDEEVLSDWANVLSVMAENGGEEAGDLWAETACKYEAAASCANIPPDRAAVNWHNWGYALSCLAESRPAVTRRRQLFRQAAAKYEEAARLNGDNLITLKNWGDVLAELAALEDAPREKGRLYETAAEKFQRATRLYPDKAGPWRRWSAMLQDRARAEQNPGRRRELWQAALEKLETGVLVKPDDPVTWIVWGRVLMELYWEGPEYERPLMAAGIIEKCEEALRLNPRDDETWNLLGRARLAAAELPAESPVDGGHLYQARLAADHFQAACDLSPDDADHWSGWGQALFQIAQIVDNEASGLTALQEAEEKFLTAMALEPDESEHHTGLSYILYQWGWRLEEPEDKRAKFQKAYDHCAEAGRLNPHDPVVWRDWAKVAEALAGLEKDPRRSVDWQNEANEKYYHADTLETPGARLRRH